MYFSYIHGKNAIHELEKLITNFFSKLQNCREKLKETKEKNPEYYKKES
jgi:hypothetical protein